MIPGVLSDFLDDAVCFVTGYIFLGEVEQEGAGCVESEGFVEVFFEGVCIDVHIFDDVCHAVEGEIREYGGLREDESLDGGVRDVSFVPEGDIFESGHDGTSDHACESCEVF